MKGELHEIGVAESVRAIQEGTLSPLDLVTACLARIERVDARVKAWVHVDRDAALRVADRKSTRLNSSHLGNSYAVFCLKKKNSEAPYGEISHDGGLQEQGDGRRSERRRIGAARRSKARDRGSWCKVGSVLFRLRPHRCLCDLRPARSECRRRAQPCRECVRCGGRKHGAADHVFCRDSPPPEIYSLSLHDALPI